MPNSTPLQASTSRWRPFVLALAALLLFLPSIALAESASPPTQPNQPTMGPGGSTYQFANVRTVHLGDSPRDVVIFLPEEVAPDDMPRLDVVILVHGFMGVDPEMYRDWINHLVRRGAIVIFPVFQSLDVVNDPPPSWPSNLLAGIQTAIIWLSDESGHDFQQQPVHTIGHSLGGPLAIRYAIEAETRGFPKPETLFVVQPGGCQPCGNFNGLGIDLSLDARLPGDLFAQMLVGDLDTTVGDADARALWPLLDAIPPAHKDYVTIRSDDHGVPPVIADHTAVGTGNRADGIDVIDWFALWRSHDALISCATTGDDCVYALGDTPEHRFMGMWSDGIPILPLLITQGPPA